MDETRSILPDTSLPNSSTVTTAVGTVPEVPGYQLGEQIGRGGMGDVYRALDRELDREVAVKILQERYPIDSPATARFVAEAKVTAQLQHPGIPAVYRVAALADGRPFLAMKLIKGQTLDELLESKTLLHHLAIIESVAQALGYAHAHDVIHRDLKPSNVMVGPFGEVQVMDWGLAKIIREPRHQFGTPADPEATTAATLIRTPSDSSSYTQHGSVLGTPAYMAPEQAGGETDRVGKTSDVFGLGALWCKLLTGEPPITGSDAESVRRNAMRGKTEDAVVRLDGCGAEPEVVALVKQCLAFEPSDRPADANAVAERVAQLRIAAEERAKQAELSRARAEVQAVEQNKRRRVVQMAGGVIAMVLLAGLGVSLWQMLRATKAEGEANENATQAVNNALAAERNAKEARSERDAKAVALEAEKTARADETEARKRAFAALHSMTKVFDTRFAQAVVLTEEDKEFIRGIIAQFDAFAAIQGDDADSRSMRAEGRFRVGLMQYRLGEFKEAETNYAAALVILKQLAADFPDRPEFRQVLAASHSNRGLLLNGTGRFKEAELDYAAALTIRKQLAAEFPTRPEFRQDLAGSHNNRGNLMRETGRLQEAEGDFNAALDIYQRLAADIPTRPEFRQDLATSHNNRGNLLRARGRLKEAAADYDSALTIRKQLAADFPARPEFRQGLADSYNSRGHLLSITGRVKEAAADYNSALTIRKQLAADFPTRPEFRKQLAASHNNQGMLFYDAGRLKEAEAAYDAALAIRKQLATDFPTRPEFRQELAMNHNNRALVLGATGRLKEAEADYDAALAIGKQLAAEFPTRLEIRQDLALSLNNRGSLLNGAGRLKEAVADFDAAVAIQKQLVAESPNRPDLRNDLAGAYVNLALLHQKQGDLTTAKRLLLEGQPHHLAALHANPRHPTYRQFYRNHLSLLIEIDARLLDQDEAVRTAATRRDLGWNPPTDAVDAAGFLSECIPIMAMHEKLDDQQRKEAAEFYTAAALKMLREAGEMGLKNAAKLKKDPAFDPLRENHDFKKLLADMETKGK